MDNDLFIFKTDFLKPGLSVSKQRIEIIIHKMAEVLSAWVSIISARARNMPVDRAGDSLWGQTGSYL